MSTSASRALPGFFYALPAQQSHPAPTAADYPLRAGKLLQNRFSPQFEQFYRILEKHGRTKNPAAVANVFSCLQDYYQTLDHDPEEIVLPIERETGVGMSAIYNGRKGHLEANHMGRAKGKLQRRNCVCAVLI